MRIMTIPCDGIGPEIMAATLDVMEVINEQFNLNISFHEEEAGFTSLENHGVTLREDVLDRARSRIVVSCLKSRPACIALIYATHVAINSVEAAVKITLSVHEFKMR